MIYLPSASAMDVRLQSPVPQLTSGENRPVERGDGEGPVWEVFLVESWRDVSVKMRLQQGPTRMLSSPRAPL